MRVRRILSAFFLVTSVFGIGAGLSMPAASAQPSPSVAASPEAAAPTMIAHSGPLIVPTNTLGASPEPGVSAPAMIAHTGSGRTAQAPVVSQQQNLDIGVCPNQTPGAYCTVTFIVSAGAFDTTFCYTQNGVYACLPPYFGYCNYATCTFEQTGGGGNPPAIPEYWIVNGYNASIIQMS